MVVLTTSKFTAPLVAFRVTPWMALIVGAIRFTSPVVAVTLTLLPDRVTPARVVCSRILVSFERALMPLTSECGSVLGVSECELDCVAIEVWLSFTPLITVTWPPVRFTRPTGESVPSGPASFAGSVTSHRNVSACSPTSVMRSMRKQGDSDSGTRCDDGTGAAARQRVEELLRIADLGPA